MFVGDNLPLLGVLLRLTHLFNDNDDEDDETVTMTLTVTRPSSAGRPSLPASPLRAPALSSEARHQDPYGDHLDEECGGDETRTQSVP